MIRIASSGADLGRVPSADLKGDIKRMRRLRKSIKRELSTRRSAARLARRRPF